MRLTIVRGLPGTGKTDYAKNMGCLHVDEDMFRHIDGEYRFEWKDGYSPRMLCELVCKLVLNCGADVVVSGCFVTVEEMQPYIDFAKKNGIKFFVVTTIDTPNPQHPVDPQLMQIMKDQWEDYDA